MINYFLDFNLLHKAHIMYYSIGNVSSNFSISLPFVCVVNNLLFRVKVLEKKEL